MGSILGDMRLGLLFIMTLGAGIGVGAAGFGWHFASQSTAVVTQAAPRIAPVDDPRLVALEQQVEALTRQLDRLQHQSVRAAPGVAVRIPSGPVLNSQPAAGGPSLSVRADFAKRITSKTRNAMVEGRSAAVARNESTYSAWATQEDDPQWSSVVEGLLLSPFVDDRDTDAVVVEAHCGASYCRLEIQLSEHHDDSDVITDLIPEVHTQIPRWRPVSSIVDTGAMRRVVLIGARAGRGWPQTVSQ